MIARKRKSRRNVKIIFPSLITSFSMVFGLVALIMATGDRLILGCYLILIASFLDGIDGKIARLTNTASEFGIQYDSLADLVVFGVAPAFVFYQYYLQDRGKDQLFVLLPIMFLLCGAIRLARFNVTASLYGKSHFTGMPIPAAAVAMTIPVPLTDWVQQDAMCIALGLDQYFVYDKLFLFSVVFCAVISLSMISNMKCDTFETFWFHKYRTKWVNYVVFGAIHLLFFYKFILYMTTVAIYYLSLMFGRALLQRLQRSNRETTVDVEAEADT